MLVKTKKILLFLLIIIFFILPVKTAYSATGKFYYRGIKLKKQEAKSTLYITPVKERRGNYILMDLVVNPNDDEINTVSTKIHFPKDKLYFLGMSKTNSFCSFFLEEEINNQEGYIKITCLKPYPGVDIISNVIGLIFLETGSGVAKVTLGEDSMVLANDGYGTNVLRSKRNQTIFIP